MVGSGKRTWTVLANHRKRGCDVTTCEKNFRLVVPSALKIELGRGIILDFHSEFHCLLFTGKSRKSMEKRDWEVACHPRFHSGRRDVCFGVGVLLSLNDFSAGPPGGPPHREGRLQETDAASLHRGDARAFACRDPDTQRRA